MFHAQFRIGNGLARLKRNRTISDQIGSNTILALNGLVPLEPCQSEVKPVKEAEPEPNQTDPEIAKQFNNYV